MEFAIEIAGFSKSYDKKTRAADGFDISVRQGAFLGFVGPNGAGKSTTVHFIAGLLKADKGSIRVFGQDVTPGSSDYKRDIGFLLERPFYLDRLTAREYLEFVGCMYGLEKSVTRARMKELTGFFGIDEPKKQIRQYSAGMKKKVSLAAALIHDPKILVLDEPFEGIDAVSSRQIKDNLFHMVEKGRTIILTSHVLDLVEKICNEIAVINKGKLVFHGPTAQIRSMFKDEKLGEKYSDLEDLFLSLISDSREPDKLSWL